MPHTEQGGSTEREWLEGLRYEDKFPEPLDPRVCEEYSGHEWAPAGGGLLICMNCESEKWDEAASTEEERDA